MTMNYPRGVKASYDNLADKWELTLGDMKVLAKGSHGLACQCAILMDELQQCRAALEAATPEEISTSGEFQIMPGDREAVDAIRAALAAAPAAGDADAENAIDELLDVAMECGARGDHRTHERLNAIARRLRTMAARPALVAAADAIATYAEHRHSCYKHNIRGTCNCGLDAAKDRYTAARSEEPKQTLTCTGYDPTTKSAGIGSAEEKEMNKRVRYITDDDVAVDREFHILAEKEGFIGDLGGKTGRLAIYAARECVVLDDENVDALIETLTCWKLYRSFAEFRPVVKGPGVL